MSRSSPTAIDAAVAQLRRLGQEVTGPPPYLTEATRGSRTWGLRIMFRDLS